MANTPITGASSVLEQLAMQQPTRSASKTLSQDTFLKLMIAQMNNQDPSKPLESGEFLSQLAQFGSLNGITQLQKSFESLASALQSNQALQASTMVGRNVLVEGNQMRLASAGDKIAGMVDLPAATGDLHMRIYNATGLLVKEIPLGAQPAGQVQFTWEGMDSGGTAAPAGIYRVTAEASINGQTVALPTLLEARVDSVSLAAGGAGARLNLAGLGAVGMEKVRAVK